jgi:uncharacterized membrane protein
MDVERRSIFRALSISMRFMICGLLIAILGGTMAFLLGERTSGPVANAAAVLTVVGVGMGLVAGTFGFVGTILRVRRRTKKAWRD